MALTKEIVKYLANLADIELPAKELARLAHQLKDILDFIDKLKKVDIANTSPTGCILPISNVLREDAARESLSCQKALENAPQREGSFFAVPKIIE